MELSILSLHLYNIADIDSFDIEFLGGDPDPIINEYVFDSESICKYNRNRRRRWF